MDNMILASHAFAENRFAIAVGQLEDDDPLSGLLIYDETFEGLWGFVEIPRILMSVTSMQSETQDKRIYVPLSDEGDVYFIEGEIENEKIPGAGVLSEDAEFGPMNMIRESAGALYAVGLGSQIYRRPPGGAWERIGLRDRDGLADCFLQAVAEAPDGGLAVCGHSRVRHRVPTPAERAEMDDARAAGDTDRYHALFARYASVEQPAAGCFYLWRDGRWASVELPTGAHMNDLCPAIGGGFLCIGDSGVMVRCDDPDAPEDVSAPDVKERLFAVRQTGGGYLVLGQSGIYRFDADLTLVEEIAPPDGLIRPRAIDAAGDAIWYFDYKGVARYRGGTWERIAIPEDLWNLEF